MEKLFFLSGLPRSGSTWIGQILNQNPRIYVPLKSPFVELLWRQYSLWSEPEWVEDFVGMEDLKTPYLKKLTNLYYSELTDKPIIVDSRRHWQSVPNIEMYADIFSELPKIICPVRDVEEIMASFSSMFRKNGIEWDHNKENRNLFDTNYLQLKNTFESKYRDCLMIIDYKDFCSNPNKMLKRLYKFIGEDFYNHNLNEVVQLDSHKKIEKVLGLNGLHNIGKGIVKSKINPNKFFSRRQINHFAEMSFWS